MVNSTTPEPPARNANRTTHGGKSRSFQVTSAIGDKYPSIYQSMIRLRRDLERRVARAKGSVGLMAAATINLVMRYDMTARIAEQMLANGETVDLKTIAWAAAKRNEAIASLQLPEEIEEPVGPDTVADSDPAAAPTSTSTTSAGRAGGASTTGQAAAGEAGAVYVGEDESEDEGEV